MENQEKIQAFADMVNATEKMARPWRTAVWVTLGTLVLTNLTWASVVVTWIIFA